MNYRTFPQKRGNIHKTGEVRNQSSFSSFHNDRNGPNFPEAVAANSSRSKIFSKSDIDQLGICEISRSMPSTSVAKFLTNHFAKTPHSDRRFLVLDSCT